MVAEPKKNNPALDRRASYRTHKGRSNGLIEHRSNRKPESTFRSDALAAAVIMIGFGLLAFYLPNIMLALGERSHVAAAIFGLLFVLSFFAIFWLRARYQKKSNNSKQR
ncbi:SoxR reducing system RseC family protein [Brucella thiophenivorans]|nr:SoxR reducing system RseC family protein [Brucella thiophenivorans]